MKYVTYNYVITIVGMIAINVAGATLDDLAKPIVVFSLGGVALVALAVNCWLARRAA